MNDDDDNSLLSQNFRPTLHGGAKPKSGGVSTPIAANNVHTPQLSASVLWFAFR